ncbi:Os05g0403200, partial [Oryza sativa Japonica Group]
MEATCVGSAKRARLRDIMPVAAAPRPLVRDVAPQVNRNPGAVARGTGMGRQVVYSDSLSVMMLPPVLTRVIVYSGNPVQVSLRQPGDAAPEQPVAQAALFARRQGLDPHGTRAYDDDSYPDSQSTQSMAPARSTT